MVTHTTTDPITTIYTARPDKDKKINESLGEKGLKIFLRLEQVRLKYLNLTPHEQEIFNGK